MGKVEQSVQPEPRAARLLKSKLVGRGPVNRAVRQQNVSRMPMIGRLFPLTENARFLSATEIAIRISARFPSALIDWEMANSRLQSELEKLEEVGTPLPIVRGHKNLFGNVVVIEIRSQLDKSIGIRFWAYLDSAIEIQGLTEATTLDRAMAYKGLVREIAGCLDYECEFTD